MNFNRINQSFLRRALTIAIAASMYQVTNAATEKEEIAQLKAEVQELRRLVQQQAKVTQVVQQQQTETTQVLQQREAKPEKRSKDKANVFNAGGADVSIYGFARLDAVSDFENSPGEFIDMSNQPFSGQEDKTQITAATSRIGIDVKKNTELGDVSAKVEGDFWGRNGSSRGNFRLRQAYVSVGNWLVGQTWSPFTAENLAPDLIDFNAIVSGSFRRTPQLRYTYPMTGNDKVYVALEDPSSGANFPDLTAKYEHKTDNLTFNVRGVVAQARDEDSDEKETGYGAAIGGAVKLNPQLSVSGQAMYLNGANKYSDTGSGTYLYDNVEDRLELNEMLGAFVGVTYKFSPKWRSTLAYGWSEFDDSNDYSSLANADDTNKKLNQANWNVIYNPVPNISLGGEYSWGKREVLSGDTTDLSRVNFMAKYSF